MLAKTHAAWNSLTAPQKKLSVVRKSYNIQTESLVLIKHVSTNFFRHSWIWLCDALRLHIKRIQEVSSLPTTTSTTVFFRGHFSFRGDWRFCLNINHLWLWYEVTSVQGKASYQGWCDARCEWSGNIHKHHRWDMAYLTRVKSSQVPTLLKKGIQSPRSGSIFIVKDPHRTHLFCIVWWTVWYALRISNSFHECPLINGAYECIRVRQDELTSFTWSQVPPPKPIRVHNRHTKQVERWEMVGKIDCFVPRFQDYNPKSSGSHPFIFKDAFSLWFQVSKYRRNKRRLKI